MQNKTNEQLLTLIQEAAAELQNRVAASAQINGAGFDPGGDQEEGGDRPINPKFP